VDPDVFGGELASLLIDQERRAQLAKGANAFAKQYDWQVIGPRLAEMYQREARAGA
jgi:glycosyltransferase involved in cell wall biosynthesis